MTPCRACSSTDAAKLFTKNNIDIVRCKNCGLEYTNTSPDITTLENIYSEKYFSSKGKGTSYFDYILEEKAMAINAKRRLQNICRLKNPSVGSRLLDVGCATGVFIEAASGLYGASGVELSEFASAYARDKKGLQVKTGTLSGANFPDKYFDVVTMWDVIEHLRSPLEDLAEVRRVIKDDGIFVISTGDVRSLFARICGRHWHLYNPEQHLSYFSKKTVGLMLAKAGFRVLRIGKDGNYFTLSYLASSLLMYYPCAITKYIYGLISRSRFRDARLSINLKDIMTVYASKICYLPIVCIYCSLFV